LGNWGFRVKKSSPEIPRSRNPLCAYRAGDSGCDTHLASAAPNVGPKGGVAKLVCPRCRFLARGASIPKRASPVAPGAPFRPSVLVPSVSSSEVLLTACERIARRFCRALPFLPPCRGFFERYNSTRSRPPPPRPGHSRQRSRVPTLSSRPALAARDEIAHVSRVRKVDLGIWRRKVLSRDPEIPQSRNPPIPRGERRLRCSPSLPT
jgi:hypothetical protein